MGIAENRGWLSYFFRAAKWAEKADLPNWFSGQLYVNYTVHPTIIELFSQEPGYVRLYRRKQR
jgi:hypothetical protein